MLQRLSIRNYAIIESVEIEFSGKLNIITGETGAGKSILVGALGLILGERADSSVLFSSNQKCIVEGVFSISDTDTAYQFLRENDLDAYNEIVIRREIAPNGKSRAFVNDTPVTLSQLKQFTSLLVNLHQQFDTLELGNSSFQMEVIDALAKNQPILKKYEEAFSAYCETHKRLVLIREEQSLAAKEADYQKFLLNELEEGNWKENELEDLETELKTLANAENVKATLEKASYELNEGDTPILQQLKGLGNQLHSLADFHPGMPELITRLESLQIELRDIAGELEAMARNVRYDEERIQLVNDRLSLGYKLLKKHGLQTTNELLEIQGNLAEQLGNIINRDTEISRLEKEENTQLKQVQELAGTLSANRHKQIQPLEKKMTQLLSQVGMPNARLQIAIQTTELNTTGHDNIEFLFDANKSNRFEPLRKIASGGELSRLMLCLKYLVAQSIRLPTLIFDEIDSGISGEAARQVGIIMQELGTAHQIISITHQPQIAAKANTHFFVYKKEQDNKITTRIKSLSVEERVDTIAQMLSGEKPSVSAIANAREMINSK